MSKNNSGKNNKTNLIIIISAIAAVIIAIVAVIIVVTNKKPDGNGETSSVASKADTSSTKSYTSAEISDIAEWWNAGVSVTNEGDTPLGK